MNQPTLIRKVLVYHLPALAYAALIIGLSSLTNVRLPRTKFVELDKVIHFVEYAVFAWLVFRSTTRLHRAIGRQEAALLAVGFVTLFAFGDEFYQSFIPGRQSDIADFFTDVIAASVVVAVLWLSGRRAERISA